VPFQIWSVKNLAGGCVNLSRHAYADAHCICVPKMSPDDGRHFINDDIRTRGSRGWDAQAGKNLAVWIDKPKFYFGPAEIDSDNWMRCSNSHLMSTAGKAITAFGNSLHECVLQTRNSEQITVQS
jgi:hypothetical protein